MKWENRGKITDYVTVRAWRSQCIEATECGGFAPRSAKAVSGRLIRTGLVCHLSMT